MNRYYCLLCGMLFPFLFYGQDIKGRLAKGTWFSVSFPETQRFTEYEFYRNKPGRYYEKQTVFDPTGKVKRWDSINIRQSSFDAEGNELVTEPGYYCDSSATYEVRKDMIHISERNLYHYYFKVRFKNDNNQLILSIVDPEEFYKK